MKAWMLLLLVGGGPACAPGPQASPAKHARVVFLAVLEGLYEEGFPPALARPLVAAVETEWFVTKCPLCEPVRFAFEIYSARPSPRMGGLGESETPAAILEGFKSPERASRHRALQALVDRYVERKLARTVMTEPDRAAFKAWAEQGRKNGMSAKRQDFGETCPSCEGVNRKK